jgi:phosphohistidine phosphatase
VKSLLLLRHAKSSWDDTSLADADRPLAPRGKKAAARMGRYLFEFVGVPAVVLCSTAVRARETWERIAAAAPAPVEARMLEELYMASPERLLGILGRLPDAADRVLVVGHNPGLEQLAQLLCREGDGKSLARMTEKFPTAALAEVELDIPRWWDIAPGRGRLRRFVAPKDLAA